MTKRNRALIAGMTDYTGVPFADILAHLDDWRENTADCIEQLTKLRVKVTQNEARLDYPKALIRYCGYFIDLFSRYLGDLEALIAELPIAVTERHILLTQQIYESSRLEERHCVSFKNDYIECALKDEGLRGLVDSIYEESRSMIIDYLDLSNLIGRLRTFLGTLPKDSKEFEQKFHILYSCSQAQRDFKVWLAEGCSNSSYSMGVVFLDIDDFKLLNSAFTESVVDRKILGPFQVLVGNLCVGRGAAYRQGGEEFVVLLPNHTLDETVRFAEKSRKRIESEEFRIDAESSKKVTASVGVSAWPMHGATLEDVMEKANQAESKAKQDGKNRVRAC